MPDSNPRFESFGVHVFLISMYGRNVWAYAQKYLPIAKRKARLKLNCSGRFEFRLEQSKSKSIFL